MIAMAKVLWRVVGASTVDALRQHPTYSLVITGHSLGGGTASLLHLWIHAILEQRDSVCATLDTQTPPTSTHKHSTIPPMNPPLPDHLHPSNVHCFSFGGPPVYYTSHYDNSDKTRESSVDVDIDAGKQQDAKQRDPTVSPGLIRTKQESLSDSISQPLPSHVLETSTHVIHANDCVPFLSVDAVRRTLSQARAVDSYWEAKIAATSYFRRPKLWYARQQINHDRVDLARSSFVEIMDVLDGLPSVTPKDGAPTLFVPAGQTVWMVPEQVDGGSVNGNENGDGTADGVSYTLQTLNPITMAQTLDIFWHSRMAADHFPPQYEKALKSLSADVE